MDHRLWLHAVAIHRLGVAEIAHQDENGESAYNGQSLHPAPKDGLFKRKMTKEDWNKEYIVLPRSPALPQT